MVMQGVFPLRSDRTSLPVSLAGSVLATGLAVCLLCMRPLQSSSSWQRNIAITLMYVGMAALVHTIAIIGLRAVFRDHVQTNVPRLLWAIWIPVAWLPLLGVLTVENSAWVLLVLPVAGVAATILLTQERVGDSDGEEVEIEAKTFFEPLDGMPLLRVLLPALGTAIALHAGIAAVAGDYVWLAALLFALACVVPAWRLLQRTRRLARPSTAAATSVVVLVCTWIALLPVFFVTQAGFALTSRGHRGIPAVQGIGAATAAGYSGIILLPPVLKKQAHIETPASLIHSTSITTRDNVIPFEGQYWFFKEPDDRPRPDAHVVKGDPLKEHIESTNQRRLLMEAHQLFPRPIALQGSSSIHVQLVNADKTPGVIVVEVLLSIDSNKFQQAVSLGAVVIPSSIGTSADAKRVPVQETLKFKIPDRIRNKSVDEISIRIRPDLGHALKASAVSVRSFSLQR